MFSENQNIFFLKVCLILFSFVIFLDCAKDSDVPQLKISPVDMKFEADQNSAYLTVENAGNGTLTWQITADKDWLSVDMSSGTTIGEVDSILVSVDRTGINFGTYTGEIRIESNGGEDTVIITMDDNNLIDIDGNVYKTVKISDQWWMMENLRVTHYRNGDPILNVADSGTWVGLSTGAYCNYDDNDGYVATYGRLYNWYAINDSRNPAPEGWHVPTDNEWKQLEMYLGMSPEEADEMNVRGTDEGGKLKEAGYLHWNSPNAGATNESGFTALAGGFRTLWGKFLSMNILSFHWSSTDGSIVEAFFRSLSSNSSGVLRDMAHKRYGMSVRCVKDQ